MVYWIAFDDETAEALVSRLRRGGAEIQHNAPVDAALNVEGQSVVVLPAPTPGRLLIARFTPRKDAHFPAAPARRIPVRSVPSSVSATSPKGVADPAKKPWWRNVVA